MPCLFKASRGANLTEGRAGNASVFVSETFTFGSSTYPLEHSEYLNNIEC